MLLLYQYVFLSLFWKSSHFGRGNSSILFNHVPLAATHHPSITSSVPKRMPFKSHFKARDSHTGPIWPCSVRSTAPRRMSEIAPGFEAMNETSSAGSDVTPISLPMCLSATLGNLHQNTSKSSRHSTPCEWTPATSADRISTHNHDTPLSHIKISGPCLEPTRTQVAPSQISSCDVHHKLKHAGLAQCIPTDAAACHCISSGAP